MNRKKLYWLIALLLIVSVGFWIYRILMPAGPVLDKIPNPVRDRATVSKDFDENKIATNPLKEAYFGDLHVHTNLSFDAFLGGTVATPSDAYRYAKGEAIEIFGEEVKIERPLDFAAVTDHAEYIGELYSIQNADAPGHYALMAQVFRKANRDTVAGRELFERMRSRTSEKRERSHLPFFKGFKTTKKAWDIHLEAAEDYYEPGKFTTFAAYEWTHNENMGHLHRNVIFRDMKVPDYPMSAADIKDVQSLWKWLKKIEEKGATVLAIPHNSNLGKGVAFPDTMKNGEPLDENYLQLSNTYEPLIEVHQAKGNSEVHASFWKNDEFANYENYDYDYPFKRNYVRYALKKGLEYQSKKQINPYKFGMIGSTDTHNGTSGNTEEDDDSFSNHTLLDWNAQNRKNTTWVLSGNPEGTEKKVYEVLNPGGLVGVWAPANTRGHLWDALKNKETFATSGGRMKVRFFGGYDFAEDYEDYETMIEEGYSLGVPMGGDLPPRRSSEVDQPPSFLIWASKDPDGANLDRIQVVKGWYKDGRLEELIYNVALSDGRVVERDGSAPDNGATVNMETGAWSQDKGAAELKTIWTDPDFDPAANTFYYLRVLEVPTARWTLWDQIRHGIEYPEGTVMVQRERAWSSPIWYVP